MRTFPPIRRALQVSALEGRITVLRLPYTRQALLPR